MSDQAQPDIEQSGVVPFQQGDDGLRILLITSISRGRWILPKGFVEPELTAGESAVKEALEEAGISGRLVDIELASLDYQKGSQVVRLVFFPFEVQEVLDHWDEAHVRERRWFSYDRARRKIELPGGQEVLDAFGKWWQNETGSALDSSTAD